ncbi:Hsp70 family protein [Actinokineospora enzanensis]|uniref:Hsp70 family protein n=1 Tax=Actinokineospora enzanensis TaxID=155975 RepID=UPI00039F2C29|nr:Hsp70 family protein [Actinokineospora enzanensis]
MTRWSLGVDLGTSFSAGAIATADRVESIEVSGERRIPSTVLLDESGRLVAGTLAQRMVGRSPDRAERNPKRYVGRRPMLLGGEPVTVQRALAALLELFVGEARRRFDGATPVGLVLTHPVAWTPAQRQVLTEVAEMVLPGVPVELIEEPVAAAVHYSHTHAADTLRGKDSVAVYDLGGGTFDTAVLTVDGSGFTVVGPPGGDPEIGGETFDERVFHHFGEQLDRLAPDWWAQVSTNPDRRWLAAASDLLTEARLAKESLSDYDDANQYVPGADVDVRITRAEFDALIGEDVRRTTRLLARSIEGSGRAPDELRGIFLTGGASRIPLVQDSLRGEYNGLVRTWQDPKTVVALGAARWAQRSLALRATPEAPRTIGGSVFPVLAEDVVDAQATNGALYTWNAVEGGHLVRKLDRAGNVERELPMAEVTGWAIAEDLVLVAERRAQVIRVHALSPELIIRSTTDIPTAFDPWLVAQGAVGWVFLRGAGTRAVDNSVGLPWGETGDLQVLLIRPATAFAPVAAAPHTLGPSCTWYINEDGARRRLIDPSMPTSIPPTALGDGRSGAVILGRTTKRRTGLRSSVLVPSQTVGTVDTNGVLSVVAEQQDTTALWVNQVVRRESSWYLGTNIGLETFAGTDRKLFVERPRAGTARWVAAGNRMYGVVQESLVPNRGLALHMCDERQPRGLGNFPGLLGNLASVEPAEAPRIRVDGNVLWIGAQAGVETSQVLRVSGVRVDQVAAAQGWLEPVGQGFALHAPDAPPGDGRTGVASLVRLPS